MSKDGEVATRNWRYRRALSASALTLAVAAFWVSEARVWRARAGYLALASARQPPPQLLSGLQVDLSRLVRWTGTGEPAAATKRHIVMVTSDACRFCHEAADAWCGFLREAPFTTTDEVVFLSLSGGRLLDHYAACLASAGRAVAFRTGQVSNAEAFAARTGIIGTPLLIVADDRWAILRWFSNEHFDQFAAFVRNGGRASILEIRSGAGSEAP